MTHVCSLCGKTFQQIKHLHGHRVDSISNNCRICLYCYYSFVNKSSEQIRKHMKSKHSDIPCGMCKRKFFMNESLADHIRDAHGGAARLSQISLNTSFLLDLQLCGNSLRRLHDEDVRLGQEKLRRCREMVHHLANFLEHNLGVWFGVSEVVQGGSLGKGTSIKEKVDIDLVVFMKRFTSEADVQEQHKDVLKRLKEHILHDFTVTKQQHYSCCTSKNDVSLRIQGGQDQLEVHLMPACDNGGGSNSEFQEMAGLSEEARSYYFLSFIKDQISFVRDKPETVKDVLRLVLHWKMREKLKIPSYTVEIITIKEWERMGSPENPDLDELFKRAMTQLSDIGSIKVGWPNSRGTGRRPIVMDPANPFNNTASEIGHSDQKVIARKARELIGWL